MVSNAERHLRLVDDNFLNELSGFSMEVDSVDEPVLQIDSRIKRVKKAPVPHSTYIKRRIGTGIAATVVVGAAALGIHAIMDNDDKLYCISIGSIKAGQEETPRQFQERAMRSKGIDPSKRSFEQAVDDAVCAKDNPQPDTSSNGMKTVFISK